MTLILASASPRRRELLAAAGLAFRVVPAQVDESPLPGEAADATVERLAAVKAHTVAALHPPGLVLGADTLVLSPRGRALGKPADLDEARAMLHELSGHAHTVLTGVCLCRQTPRFEEIWHCRSVVRFRTLDNEAVERYLRQVNTLDKAGAYAVQECGELIIERVDGLLSNVIGLPVEEVLARLRRAAE